MLWGAWWHLDATKCVNPQIWGFTQLQAALQACGTMFENKPVEGDVPGTFVIFAEGCSGSGRPLQKCGCKACLPCLTAAGVMAAN